MVWCAEGHQIIYNAYDSQQKFLQERCIEFLSPITQYYKSVDLQIENRKTICIQIFVLHIYLQLSLNKNYREKKDIFDEKRKQFNLHTFHTTQISPPFSIL